jgi:hypothetical protein
LADPSNPGAQAVPNGIPANAVSLAGTATS